MNRMLKSVLVLLTVLGMVGCTLEVGVEALDLTAEPSASRTDGLDAPGEAIRLQDDAAPTTARLDGEDAAGQLDAADSTPTPSAEPPPTATRSASAGGAASAASASRAVEQVERATATQAIFDFPAPTPDGPLPEVISFSASPGQVIPGGSVTLYWEADGDVAELWVQSPRGTLRRHYGEVPLSGNRTFALDPSWGPQVNFGLSVHRSAINTTTTAQVDIFVFCLEQPDGTCLPYTPTPVPPPTPLPTPVHTRTPVPTPSAVPTPTPVHTPTPVPTEAVDGGSDSL